MFPYRGLLAIIIIGIGVGVISTGVVSLPTVASLTDVAEEVPASIESLSSFSMTTSQSVDNLKKVLDTPSKNVIVVDVRSPEEWKAQRIDHPLVQSIPLTDLLQDSSQISPDTEVYIICQSGNRSQIAQVALRSRGIYTSNVEGGMNAWNAAGYSTVSEN